MAGPTPALRLPAVALRRWRKLAPTFGLRFALVIGVSGWMLRTADFHAEDRHRRHPLLGLARRLARALDRDLRRRADRERPEYRALAPAAGTCCAVAFPRLLERHKVSSG